MSHCNLYPHVAYPLATRRDLYCVWDGLESDLTFKTHLAERDFFPKGRRTSSQVLFFLSAASSTCMVFDQQELHNPSKREMFSNKPSKVISVHVESTPKKATSVKKFLLSLTSLHGVLLIQNDCQGGASR